LLERGRHQPSTREGTTRYVGARLQASRAGEAASRQYDCRLHYG
jgi:hypothetical protein